MLERIQRRGFLLGAAALILSPAVVNASSLMPIRGEKLTEFVMPYHFRPEGEYGWRHITETVMAFPSEADNIAPTSRTPGTYRFSTTYGAPGERTVSRGGIILPSRMRLHIGDRLG